ESINVGTGHGPLNPWLHECPDPITRLAWGNYASLAPAVARRLNIKNGDIIQLNSLKIPAFIQPGQAENTISIAVGYGRTTGIPKEIRTGINAYPMAELENGSRRFIIHGLKLETTGE